MSTHTTALDRVVSSGPAPLPLNSRRVRLAIDLIGVSVLLLGLVTGVFVLVFGGGVIAAAGACLHAAHRRPA
ncbi:hypothetical protein [Lentzea sp. NPDC003310]|uniref:hypothetical protein n=1 Tax=Lentzea sp. NPDC003310 TaxID=3154447 RepID=UPI0033A8FA27